MKTAKEICEEIEVAKEYKKLREVNHIIRSIEHNGGIAQFGVYKLEIIDELINPFSDFTKEKLLELGYTIKIKKRQVEVGVDTIRVENPRIAKFLFWEYKTIDVYYRSEPRYELCKYVEVSACCGE